MFKEKLDVWTIGKYGQASAGMVNFFAEPGIINITESGNYFIYSQVYFQMPFGDPKTDAKLSADEQRYMSHFVLRESKGEIAVLLKGVKTNAYQGKKASFFTSFVSGVFRCKVGDSLFVGVDKKLSAVVNTNMDSTFFGAFKL